MSTIALFSTPMDPLRRVVHATYTRSVPSRLLHRERGLRPPAEPGEVSLTWLGTAGLVLEHDGRVLVIDPFVTRPGLFETVTRRLAPDPGLVSRYVPRADVILCTHSHHDHLLDAPEVARQTGALVLGSASTCNLCRASGVPEAQLREVHPPEVVEEGPFRLELRPSVHGKAVAGRVPLSGVIPPEVQPPLRFYEFRTEGTIAASIEVGAGDRPCRIFHLGSADFLPETISGLECDVLAPCLAGRDHRPGYVGELLTALRPTAVVPIHYDDFFTPIGSVTRQLASADLEGFRREVGIWGDGCRCVTLDRLDGIRIRIDDLH
jgi:L-ascorbate metabolism protein UlaG (beta-lactamase superfamily)